MKDCLVIEYKKATNNKNLPLENGFTVVVDPGTFEFSISPNVGTVIKCDNEVDTINMGSSATYFPYTVVSTPASPIRYNGTLTRKTTFTIEGGLYGNTYLKANGGNIALLKDTISRMVKFGAINELIAVSGQLECGTMLQLNSFKNDIKRIQVYTGNSDMNIEGDIVSLGDKYSLIQIALHRRNAAIYGKVEDMLSAMCSGRTSGTFEFDLRYDAVTFHNLLLENISASESLKATFSGTGCSVETSSSHTPVATYNKSNNTWTYE